MLPEQSTRFLYKISIIISALALTCIPLTASARVHHHKAHHVLAVDGGASYSDIVIDAETGRILHASNPDSLRHPASLTKMMTLYITFQAIESGRLRLDQYLNISTNAAEQSPSKLGLRPHQRIRVEDAILGLVTESANDAAVVLAEALGGSEAGFGKMMTEQAHALGMSRTRFDNPSGLPDPEQVTTARDMATLGHSLIFHYPEFYHYFSRDNFVYSGINHHNHNRLMDRYAGMDGIKTGYIRASGFNLVASATRGNTRLIGVVFGGRSTTSRDNRMAQLLDESFVQSRQEKNDGRMASETTAPDMAQGDGAESGESGEYVTLPAKVSAVFENGENDARAAAPAAGGYLHGGWGIQIGAYTDPELARRSLARIVNTMPQILNRAEPLLQKISAPNETTYRARLMGLDEQNARAVCSWFLQHGQACLLVEP